jgi:hypothetical protein
MFSCLFAAKQSHCCINRWEWSSSPIEQGAKSRAAKRPLGQHCRRRRRRDSVDRTISYTIHHVWKDHCELWTDIRGEGTDRAGRNSLDLEYRIKRNIKSRIFCPRILNGELNQQLISFVFWLDRPGLNDLSTRFKCTFCMSRLPINCLSLAKNLDFLVPARLFRRFKIRIYAYLS